MNYTFNFSDIVNTGCEYDLTFESAINNYCESWKGYSTYAHEFYMILVIIFSSIGIIRNTFKFDPIIKIKETVIEIGKFKFKIDKEEIKILLWIQHVLVYTLMIRIIQVWYIVKYILGG